MGPDRSTFIDLSGTDRLPEPSDLLESVSAVLKYGSIVGESIRRAHDKWSFLAEAYAAPEHHEVHRAMDSPLETGEAVLRATSHAASALQAFAAVVAEIRSRRLDLQAEVAVLQEKEDQSPAPATVPPEQNVPLSLPGILLQNKADQLALELSSAEDECIRSLS